MTALLQTTYFGPVQWYQKLYRYDHCLIEQYDSYQKQTYRNRCIVATANGLQALTVPVEVNGEKCLVKDVRISDHNNWRRVHWNALMSAYSESPFFDYYADDIRPFFEKRYDYLVDFNEAIRHAKHPQPDSDFEPRPYWQVFSSKHGFLSNLSILDLLFCMGPESIFYL